MACGAKGPSIAHFIEDLTILQEKLEDLRDLEGKLHSVGMSWVVGATSGLLGNTGKPLTDPHSEYVSVPLSPSVRVKPTRNGKDRIIKTAVRGALREAG